MGRLLTVTKGGVQVEEYHYDAAGTRTYERNTLRNITRENITYRADDGLLNTGDASYQHDADGFLKTKTEGAGITTYDYSSRGELRSVTLPDTRIIEYVHDPLGRRIAKKISGTISEKYLWQGRTRLLAVYSGNDILRFEYADARMPFAMTKNGTTYFLTYDQVGSLRTVADALGVVVKQIDYDSFGNVINDTNSAMKVPFGFAGGLHDRDTGLVRFGYRDYDPDTGRWTAKDPIGFGGGDTDLYGYCVNDPVNFADPWGLETGIWTEGSSPEEPGPHQSIGVGDPLGEYSSYSFGVKEGESMFGGKGDVYRDWKIDGKIYDYYPVSDEVAEEIRKDMESQIGTEDRYHLGGNNCRHWTKKTIDKYVGKYGLKKGTPPPKNTSGYGYYPSLKAPVSISSPGPTK